MIQDILAISTVIVALFFAIVSTIRFFQKRDDKGSCQCSGDCSIKSQINLPNHIQ